MHGKNVYAPSSLLKVHIMADDDNPGKVIFGAAALGAVSTLGGIAAVAAPAAVGLYGASSAFAAAATRSGGSVPDILSTPADSIASVAEPVRANMARLLEALSEDTAQGIGIG